MREILVCFRRHDHPQHQINMMMMMMMFENDTKDSQRGFTTLLLADYSSFCREDTQVLVEISHQWVNASVKCGQLI